MARTARRGDPAVHRAVVWETTRIGLPPATTGRSVALHDGPPDLSARIARAGRGASPVRDLKFGHGVPSSIQRSSAWRSKSNFLGPSFTGLIRPAWTRGWKLHRLM